MPSEPTPPSPSVPRLRLGQGFVDATGFLLIQVERDGKIRYCTRSDPSAILKQRYSLVRHAGVIHALGLASRMLSDHGDGAAAADAARVRATDFLLDRCQPVDGDPSVTAIWSDPVADGYSGAPVARTGVAGAALAAIETVDLEFVPLEVRRGIGAFLRSMQEADGSFVDRVEPARGGRVSKRAKAPVLGQAALGLATLGRTDPAGEWTDLARHALLRHIASAGDHPETAGEHWNIAAIEALQSRVEADVRETLIAHGVRVCEAILAEQVAEPGSPRDGGFSAEGLTVPTATRCQALLSALKFLPEHRVELRSAIERAAQRGVVFLLRARITNTEYVGGMPRAVGPAPVSYTGDREEFDRRVEEVRIDTVQHALTAWIEYMRRITAECSTPIEA